MPILNANSRSSVGSSYQIIKKNVETFIIPLFQEQMVIWEQKEISLTDKRVKIQLILLWDHMHQATEDFWIQQKFAIKHKDESKQIPEEITVGKIYEFFLHHHLEWKDQRLRILPQTSEARQLGKVYTPFPVIRFINQFIIQNRLCRRFVEFHF